MITQQDIQQVVDQIVAKFQPRKVILFGSRAEGRERPDSDVDLLVILPFDDHPARKAVEIGCAIEYRFPLDLLARTPEDTAHRYRWGDPLVRGALNRGQVMYESAPEGPDVVREAQITYRDAFKEPPSPVITQQDIQSVVDQIVAKFHPERIILFGSRAEGRARPDSNVDLLVILPFEGNSLRKAVEIVCALDYHFPLDLVVHTPEDFEHRRLWHDPFVCAAAERGRVLYERAA